METNKLTPPAMEDRYLLYRTGGDACAVSARGLLLDYGFHDPRISLYEAPLLSTVTGEQSPGPMFRGFADSITVPLLLCKDDRAGAIVINEKTAYEKKDQLFAHIQDRLNITVYDLSHLRSLEALNRHYTNYERKIYLEHALGARKAPETGPGAILDEDDREGFAEFEDEEDYDYPFADDYDPNPFGPDDDPVYAGKEYQELVDSRVKEITDQFQSGLDSECSEYKTIPAADLIRALGIVGDPVRLMEQKHLITGPAHIPTAFGRQCGLVVKLGLQKIEAVKNPRAVKLTRELRVCTQASEAFKSAISYTKALAQSPDAGGRFDDRITRIRQWKPSSAQSQSKLFPQLTGALKQTLDTPLTTIRDRMSKAGMTTHFEALQSITKAKDTDTYAGLILSLWDKLRAQGRDSPAWEDSPLASLPIHASTCRTRKPHPIEGKMPFSDRIKRLSNSYMPIDDFTLSQFFQSVSAACDSTYPQWYSEACGLPRILSDLDLGPQSPIDYALYRVTRSIDPANHPETFITLIIAPLALALTC